MIWTGVIPADRPSLGRMPRRGRHAWVAVWLCAPPAFSWSNSRASGAICPATTGGRPGYGARRPSRKNNPTSARNRVN